MLLQRPQAAADALPGAHRAACSPLPDLRVCPERRVPRASSQFGAMSPTLNFADEFVAARIGPQEPRDSVRAILRLAGDASVIEEPTGSRRGGRWWRRRDSRAPVRPRAKGTRGWEGTMCPTSASSTLFDYCYTTGPSSALISESSSGALAMAGATTRFKLGRPGVASQGFALLPERLQRSRKKAGERARRGVRASHPVAAASRLNRRAHGFPRGLRPSPPSRRACWWTSQASRGRRLIIPAAAGDVEYASCAPRTP